jgi:uncharacterized protein
MDDFPTPPPTPPSVPEASPPVVSPPVSLVPNQDEKTLAIVMHVLGLVGFPIVGPLIVWLIKKDASSYLDAQGRELLSFQLSVLIYSFVSFLLCFILIGVPMIIAIGAASLVLTIIGLVKASDGQIYRFPWIIRFF